MDRQMIAWLDNFAAFSGYPGGRYGAPIAATITWLVNIPALIIAGVGLLTWAQGG